MWDLGSFNIEDLAIEGQLFWGEAFLYIQRRYLDTFRVLLDFEGGRHSDIFIVSGALYRVRLLLEIDLTVGMIDPLLLAEDLTKLDNGVHTEGKCYKKQEIGNPDDNLIWIETSIFISCIS